MLMYDTIRCERGREGEEEEESEKIEKRIAVEKMESSCEMDKIAYGVFHTFRFLFVH